MTRPNQIAASKEMIKDALLRIMETKEFEAITMSEIAEEAQVVRMTLYRHFKDKEQILLYYFEGYYHQALEKMNTVGEANLNNLLQFRFKILKQSPYTKLMAKDPQLFNILNQFSHTHANNFKQILPQIEDGYKKQFIWGGVNAITKKWIEDGMKESSKEMADKITELIYRVM